jgi:hypothetical protein
MTGLAWPRENTVVAADLQAITASDYTTTIVSSANLTRGASASPISAVDGRTVLVSDAAVSDALRAAAASTDLNTWNAAMSSLTEAIAGAARTQPGTQATLFATLPRALPVSGSRLAETLNALALDARISGIPVSMALASPPDPATIVDAAQPADRVAEARLLLEADANVGRFASIAADPAAITGPERLSLLALLSNAWESTQSGWRTAVDNHLRASTELLGLVQVGETSRLNLLADRQTLPIPIVNGLGQAITVVVTVDPNRPILAIEDRQVELTVEPNSQANALVPVQAVSNGTVQIEVTLSSSTGTAIGTQKDVEVVVNAGWETPIFVVLASGVVLLFVGGIVRNIVRRRRELAGGVDG